MQYRDTLDFVLPNLVLGHELTIVVSTDGKRRRERIAEHELCTVVHTGHFLLNRDHWILCEQPVFIRKLRRNEAGVEALAAEVTGQEEHRPVSRGVIRIQRSVLVLHGIVHDVFCMGVRRFGLCACACFRDEIGLDLNSAEPRLRENTPASVCDNL